MRSVYMSAVNRDARKAPYLEEMIGISPLEVPPQRRGRRLRIEAVEFGDKHRRRLLGTFRPAAFDPGLPED